MGFASLYDHEIDKEKSLVIFTNRNEFGGIYTIEQKICDWYGFMQPY